MEWRQDRLRRYAAAGKKGKKTLLAAEGGRKGGYFATYMLQTRYFFVWPSKAAENAHFFVSLHFITLNNYFLIF